MNLLALPPIWLGGWFALLRVDAHAVMVEALYADDEDPDSSVADLIYRLDDRIRFCQRVMRSERGRWAFPALN